MRTTAVFVLAFTRTIGTVGPTAVFVLTSTRTIGAVGPTALCVEMRWPMSVVRLLRVAARLRELTSLRISLRRSS